MPNDFGAESYGHTFQRETQGVHGSHRAPVVTPREVEQRTGVESLEVLQRERALRVKEAADLRAYRDIFDAERKSERGKILARENAKRLKNGEKEIPASTAETVASAHDDYVAYLVDRRLKFARLAILEDEITAYTERIRSRHAELYAYGAEARLG